ncbi:MAG: hypothetical protein K0S84_1604 [Nitrososphaera sp.]|jgi:hypothetical protein|nr:hypothetical protein [Nitrososphaera sp.]
MLTTLKVKVRERQVHYIDQIIVRSLNSVNRMMLKRVKLNVDILRKYGKWKSDAMEGI